MGLATATPSRKQDGTTFSGAVVYCPNCTALGSGSTLTGNWTGTSNIVGASATYATSAATTSPVDAIPATIQSGTSVTSATSISSGTLAQADELLIAWLGVGGGNTGITPGGSWTTIGRVAQGNTSLNPAYQVVSATAAVAWAPTWSGSAGYKSQLVSFKGAPQMFPPFAALDQLNDPIWSF
jgi:hypothetical protein